MSFHLVYSLLLLQFVLGYTPFEHNMGLDGFMCLNAQAALPNILIWWWMEKMSGWVYNLFTWKTLLTEILIWSFLQQLESEVFGRSSRDLCLE